MNDLVALSVKKNRSIDRRSKGPLKGLTHLKCLDSVIRLDGDFQTFTLLMGSLSIHFSMDDCGTSSGKQLEEGNRYNEAIVMAETT